MTVGVASTVYRPISLFSIYAPEDVSLHEQLERHLSSLKRQGLITLWSLDKTLPGADRDVEIERNLNTAQIILLLLSAEFLASEYCFDVMTRALRRRKKDHICVIPILLRPVDWEMLPMSELQVLPTNGKPVTSWRNRDDAYLLIAKGIRKIILAQLNPMADHWTNTENYLSYLHWLIKRTASLDTGGTHSTRSLPQIKLEEVYIPLQARPEEVLQTIGPTSFSRALATESSMEDQPPPSLTLSQIVARHDHLVLLGEPGGGKTTFLHYLAFKHALALSNQVEDARIREARFPILLRIADYVEYGMRQGKALSEFLTDDCARHECPTPALAALLNSELQAGRCLVLFDGLDEVVHADDRRIVARRLEEFVRRYDDVPNRFIITSRGAGYSEAPLSSNFAHYTLRELEETDIRRFLESWCPTVEIALSPGEETTTRETRATHEITNLMKAIQNVPGVRQLASNPLLLRILAQLHRAGVPLPRRRAALYHQITETLTQTWRTSQGVPASALSKISSLFGQPYLTYLLSRLAYWLHVKKPGGFASELEMCRVLGKEWARLTDRPRLEEDPDSEQEMKQFLMAVREQTGILVEDTPHQYGFAHLTFEEYYAGCYLVANSQKQAKRIRAHLHDPLWQEPILLALSLIGMESQDEADVLVETAILAEGEEARAKGLHPSPYEPLLGRDFLFTLRCLGDDIPMRTALVERLTERLLREITQQTGPGRFQKYQEALVEGLRKVETSHYASFLLPHLFENIESSDRSLRLWSLYCLGRIMRAAALEQEKVHLLFLQTLHDEDPMLRTAALWGMSQMTGHEVTGTLLEVLSNDIDLSVKEAVVKYLGERGEASPQVIKVLLDVLYEATAPDGFLLRNAVVKSLGQLGDTSPAVISALIALLPRDLFLLSDESVIESLRQLSRSSSEVVPLMMNALQHVAPAARVAIAEALETFDHVSPTVLEELCNIPIQRSHFKPFQVPFCIKQWYWLPDEVEALLLYQLHDPRVRWEAVKALGQLEELSDRAEDALLMTLQDENAHVRARVVETLNAFEMSPGVLTTFINVLSSDSDAYVRARTAECLGDLEQPSEDVKRTLLNALYDTDAHVRTCSVKSLGRIAPASPEVLAALLFALRHDAFFGVRWEAVRGLESLKELPKLAVPVIVQALSDEDWIVRRDSAHLLGQSGSSDKRTIQALLRGLSDNDMPVRKACSDALVQLGQRFPQSRETITLQLARIIQWRQNDATGYNTPCNVTYEALWFLVNGGPFERR
jgi:HEAT repeat protein